MRKSFIVLSLAIVASIVTGCLDNVQSSYTPEIHLYSPLLNPYYQGDTLRAADTLKFSYNEGLSMYLTDTIDESDTVMVSAIFYGVGNVLTGVRVEWDSTCLNTWLELESSIRNALSDTTTIGSGYLPFNPNYNLVSFPIYFTPRKSGLHTIKMTVETDSKYSPVSLSFGVPVN